MQFVAGKKVIVSGLPVELASIVRVGFLTDDKGLFFNVDGQASFGFLLGEINAEANYEVELYDFRTTGRGRRHYEDWVRAAADSVKDGDMSAKEALKMLRGVVFEPDAVDSFIEQLEQPRSELLDPSGRRGPNLRDAEQKLAEWRLDQEEAASDRTDNDQAVPFRPRESARRDHEKAGLARPSLAEAELERDSQMQRLDASSPQFDAQAALLHRLEEMQAARRAEARPPHEIHKHLPQGRLLLTSAKRSGEYKGHLRVPVPERRPPPSRRESLDALSAHYGGLLRQSKGTPLEAALQKEFVVAFRAVQLDQDQRDRETAWAHATKADPEIGGRNLAQSLQDARYGLDRFGDPELYDYLDDSGLGNHPEVIRMFKRAGAYARKERPWAPTTVDRPGWQERERPKGLQWLSALVPTTQSDVP